MNNHLAGKILSGYVMIPKIKPLSFFLLLILLSSQSFSSDFRINALGNTGLVLQDEDNDLNLYDMTCNPAYLLFDENRNWLKFYSSGNYYNTSLKRQYDPEKEQNLSFNFIGFKKLTHNQAVLGRVNYHFNNKYHRMNAIEENPYADDPLVLTDSISGNFYSDGPGVDIIYHYQPFSKLGLGAGIIYEISTGLKKQYTRPRTIHRNFEGKIALTYRLTSDLILGSYLATSRLQDQIELVKSWDGRDIFTRRYRSELVYREILGEFDRYYNLDGWHFNLALQFYPGKANFQNLLVFNYLDNTQETTDQAGTKRNMDSYWYQKINLLTYYGRFFLRRMVIGLKLAYMEESDWSKHPSLPILITERSRQNYEVGLGLSYNFNRLLLLLEGDYNSSSEIFHDYQSALNREGTNNYYSARFGSEIKLDPIHYLMLGYNYNYFNPNYQSPQFLPEYKAQYFSAGLSERRARYEISLYYNYELKNAIQDGSSFSGWNALIYTRLYMF